MLNKKKTHSIIIDKNWELEDLVICTLKSSRIVSGKNSIESHDDAETTTITFKTKLSIEDVVLKMLSKDNLISCHKISVSDNLIYIKTEL